jgi:integrase/recombinase XerD
MENHTRNIQGFEKILKLKGRQNSTIASYSRDIKNFIDFLVKFNSNIGKVSTQTLLDFQSYLKEECHEKENSIRRAVIAIRQYFRYMEDEKLIHSSPLNLLPIPPRNEELPEEITSTEIDQLLLKAKNTSPEIKGRRDAAIIALLGFEGVKAAEIINLSWNDYLEEKMSGSLKLSGPKSRVISLCSQTTILLNSYKELYNNIVFSKLEKTNNMFVAFKGRDAAKITPTISRHGIKFMLYEIGDKVEKEKLNTEMLRHHAINYLLLNGKGPDDIMQHLGLKRLGNIAKHIAKENSNRTKENQIEV